MICTACGAENDAGRKFCLQCGQRLAVACPSCGTANPAGARFCGECGGPLGGADAIAGVPAVSSGASTGPAQSRTTTATERRLVSVLFADLVGFTTISESRDAEDVRALLDRYFATSREIVERYGGIVEKFIGDAVMAVWGTPVAQEDDAERAVRAALDLVDAARALGQQAGVPDLALRAGVLTGEAVVTIGATGMGMVAGDVVNTASRLQSVSAPGSVLVGEATRRAASEAIVFEPAGEQTLKGKESPVPAFRALRVVAQRGGVGRSELLEPPFVGRDPELRLIKDFYHATAREQGPRLVSVIGQAGIGKSRLAWEFLKYIDGVTENVWWHEGRSPAYGDGISFWALGEMVRMRAGIGEGADAGTTRERISASLTEFVVDPDERASLEGPLLHLLGISDETAFERSALFVAWRTFFERIADQGPVVMVFEDLQWADDGLLDFIEDLVTWSRGRSIYVITLARPELLDRRPTWGAGLRAFTSLSLQPLSDEDVRTLLDGLVPGLPSNVTEAIVARAEGVPLYAVETVRMLLNDGRIERDGDRFRPVGDLSALAVPESLHALIAARIDALPAAERALLQDASVLGQSFSREALVAVTRVDEGEVDGMLRHLAQRELIDVDDDPRSPERGQYRFVQGLLREVAYGTLARDDRRTRHLAAARYYETLGDDERAGVLAQHYVDAYQAHPDGPEGAAVAAQARVALRAASQRAAALGSHRRALQYIESALSVTTDQREELDLRVAAGTRAGDAGLMEPAVTHLERAIDIARLLGEHSIRRRATTTLADVLTEGRQKESQQLLEQLLAEPDFDESDPEYLNAATQLAKVHMRRLEDLKAIELADRMLPLVERGGDQELALDLLITRGVALGNLNRNVEATALIQGALESALRGGHVDVALRGYTNLGYVLASDDVQAAHRVSREGVEMAIKTGKTWPIRYLVGNAIDGALEIGEWDWLLRTVAEQDQGELELAERIWYSAYRLLVETFRGEEVEHEAGEIYEASRTVDDLQYLLIGSYPMTAWALVNGHYDRVMQISDGLLGQGPINAAEVAAWAARAAAWAGDVEALRRYAEASRATRSGRRSEVLLHATSGQLAALEGRDADARAAFAAALRLSRDLGLRFWTGLIALDVLTLGAMEPDERARAADEARVIFTDLGATPLLRRLDQVGPPTSQRGGSARGQEAPTEAAEVPGEA
ncbi:MAG TPA: adenylate/guanylate cyclase domain-containing protein [Candidatus Limnocylindria bacterium]|nr:adenylate/guanylate cyclase domain-containing protein [Candidatus Limnocylindria bacterium]